jgi:hypothetical protein
MLSGDSSVGNTSDEGDEALYTDGGNNILVTCSLGGTFGTGDCNGATNNDRTHTFGGGTISVRRRHWHPGRQRNLQDGQ